jgi:hypothetical protein
MTTGAPRLQHARHRDDTLRHDGLDSVMLEADRFSVSASLLDHRRKHRFR